MLIRRRRPQQERMTLVGHLTELRYRLIVIICALVIGVLIGFYYSGAIVEYLHAIPGELVYLYPGEAFFAHLEVALILGVVIASPVILAQLARFVLPALNAKEKRMLLMVIPVMILFLAAGFIFAYQVIVPIAYRFFMEFGTESLRPLISIGSYVSFVVGIVLPFGLIFQLPIAVLLLTSIGVLKPQVLVRSRKMVVVVIFVIAAILTPPDVISQILMAGPMLLLFELSVLIARIVFRRRMRRSKQSE